MHYSLPLYELNTIKDRMRLKASGCRLMTALGTGWTNGDRQAKLDLIDAARELTTCLWMCAPTFDVPDDPNVLLHLADCFDITADGIALLQDALASADKNGVTLEDCLDLVGKAQIALRAAVAVVNNRHDNDQNDLFLILREAAGLWRHYIPLKCVDGDSPTAEELPALRERIATMQKLLEQGRVFQERLATLKQQVAANPQTTAQWRVVSNQVSRLVEEGMAPSNIQLREILLPTFEAIPECDEFNPHFNLVLREIDRYLESRPEIDDTLDQDEPTAEVLQVRKLLEGRKLLLIGGSHRLAAKQKLKEAFALQDMIWLTTKPHDSYHDFKPKVYKSGVAVVLLAIRFSSHTFSNTKKYCDKAGIPFVRLPAGYNRNQVAHQILDQCGPRLERLRNSA